MPSSSLRQPPSWPSNVQYINAPRYHPSVPGPVRSFLICGTNPAPQKTPISFPSTSLVRIRQITEPSHPARGQNGIFAVRKIPPRSHIIDYIGEVHCQDRAGSDYDLSLFRSQDGDNVGVDASVMGNEARFINDYRGIRSKPNAVFVESRTSQGELRMSIWSSTDPIQKGHEILVSYGKSWWRTRITQTDAISDLA
ncbi:SET domain protein [Suillus clintonianus]|uniref:SET domain protein n=1 Tax=Suillus clintonianus TaxID=1904413 RepID=UPI001B86A6EE|nr:SET domain protein [Suillus clintonianus]KAG2155449.1 SET domain protein [Suillus clintonianus]